jgi:hypothetical protein
MANYFLDDTSEAKMLHVKSSERDHTRLKADASQSGLLQGDVLKALLSLNSLTFKVYLDRISSGKYPSYYRNISPLFLTAVEVCSGLGLLDEIEKRTVLSAAANLPSIEEAFRVLHGVLTPKMPEQQNLEKRARNQDEQDS